MALRLSMIPAVVAMAAASSFGAEPGDAVVRITSHGASGVVVYSEPGRTLILSAGHAFDNRAARLPITLDVPGDGRPAGLTGSGTKRLLRVDYDSDLALVRLDLGPLPGVCPVAASEPSTSARLVSTGYDGMRWPAVVATAHVVAREGRTTFTRERPVEGRSGGPLIDADRRLTVGIVNGYETSGLRRGVYTSRSECVRFLERAARSSWDGPRPDVRGRCLGLPWGE